MLQLTKVRFNTSNLKFYCQVENKPDGASVLWMDVSHEEAIKIIRTGNMKPQGLGTEYLDTHNFYYFQ